MTGWEWWSSVNCASGYILIIQINVLTRICFREKKHKIISDNWDSNKSLNPDQKTGSCFRKQKQENMTEIKFGFSGGSLVWDFPRDHCIWIFRRTSGFGSWCWPVDLGTEADHWIWVFQLTTGFRSSGGQLNLGIQWIWVFRWNTGIGSCGGPQDLGFSADHWIWAFRRTTWFVPFSWLLYLVLPADH